MINMRSHHNPNYSEDNWPNQFYEEDEKNSNSENDICKIVKETYKIVTT